jgi:sugar O-acyltransferase (sialic acid O-acetyltransferase NeuD family)
MDIVLLGAGGQAKDMLKNIEEYNLDAPKSKRFNVIGCLDDTNHIKKGAKLPGYRILTSMKVFEKPSFRKARVICAVGDPLGKKIFERKARWYNLVFFNLIHPTVSVPKTCKLGTGVSIFSNSIVSAFCEIGDHVSVNYLCSISHDCTIGDLVTLAPGVKIAGRCILEEGCFLGINSCVINNIKIGEWSVVGAGTPVVKDVLPNSVVVGGSCRVLSSRDKNKPLL